MSADNAPALVLRSLTKSFGRPAVDRLDLTIGAGEFYALLGPNGAGKTTTLRLVAGLLPADDGDKPEWSFCDGFGNTCRKALR